MEDLSFIPVQAIKEKGEIRITTYQKDNYINVEARDNGIGIPEQNLPKIFKLSLLTKRSGKERVWDFLLPIT